jgi:tetratricopeptide (TPR) repeat protein
LSVSKPRDCCLRCQSEMSYIHDALRKAQKEKGTQPQKYQGIVPTVAEKPRFSFGKALWAVPVLLACVGFAVYLWPSSQNQRSPGPEPQRPETAAERIVAPEAPTKPKTKVTPTSEPGKRREGSVVAEPGTKAPGFLPTGEYSPATSVSSPPPEVSHELSEAPVAKPGPAPQSPPMADAAALYEKALSFQKLGRLQEAKAFYEETLAQDPKHVDALNNIGVIYIREKDYPAAREVFSAAIRLRPDYVDAYYNLACVYAIEERLPESLAHLQKAVSLDRSVRDWARQDTDLANLRSMPEFEAIVGGGGG